MHEEVQAYNHAHFSAGDRAICDLLAREIDRGLPKAENKVWHAHPVWFLDGTRSWAIASRRQVSD